jgi:hypothetical protein
VQVRDEAVSEARQPIRLTGGTAARRLSLLGGGTDGNEQLTAVTGVLLVVLLAVIGLTILRIRQLISVHLFVGLLLMGPVALKMGSTGYRFLRYYTRNPAYRHKGPPEPILRAVAPLVVISTLGVFISGLLLLIDGASSKDRWLELHKVTFIVWVVFTGLHVLGHLPGMPRHLKAVPEGGGGLDSARNGSMIRAQALGAPGGLGRWLALAGVIVAGVVLAIALIPDYHSWQHAAAFHHHDG